MLVDLSHYADDPELLTLAEQIFAEVNGRTPSERDHRTVSRERFDASARRSMSSWRSGRRASRRRRTSGSRRAVPGSSGCSPCPSH